MGKIMRKITFVILIAIAIVGCSALASTIVHHHDSTSFNHAMMVSDAMQKKSLKWQSASAAMKQAEKDKMIAAANMQHTQTMSTGSSVMAQ
jgi:uncharacterized protein YcfL